MLAATLGSNGVAASTEYLVPSFKSKMTKAHAVIRIPAHLIILLAFFTVYLGAYSQEELPEETYESVLLKISDGGYKNLKNSVVSCALLNDTRFLPILKALANKRLFADDSKTLYMGIDDPKDSLQAVLTGEIIPQDSVSVKVLKTNNSVRRVLKPVIAQFELRNDDPTIRRAAAEEISKRLLPESLGVVREHIKKEGDSEVRSILFLAVAQADLTSEDPAIRLDAINQIGNAREIRFRGLIEEVLAEDEEGVFLEKEENVLVAAQHAIAKIDNRQMLIKQTGNLFYGLSLGSVLLLVALGLSITFGVMGVINMAHGEMIMLGAYATYVVHDIFNDHLSAYFDWYLVVAVPVAFIFTALVGILLERIVIHYLYDRPLDTLLATWGVSLILIQTVRLSFGAQNVAVANPSWLSGGVSPFEGVVYPYSRIAIILFAICVIAFVSYLLQWTPLGLQVRAVSQRRAMAECMGISSKRVDMWTFGLGSGIAGLAGVALSQITNVNPELGQGYIIDSFMVVVLGGVGKIAGTVVGGLGLGVVNKFLEPVSGAVLGKILVLVFLILFIQKRPQGIFAPKGRDTEN